MQGGQVGLAQVKLVGSNDCDAVQLGKPGFHDATARAARVPTSVTSATCQGDHELPGRGGSLPLDRRGGGGAEESNQGEQQKGDLEQFGASAEYKSEAWKGGR